MVATPGCSQGRRRERWRRQETLVHFLSRRPSRRRSWSNLLRNRLKAMRFRYARDHRCVQASFSRTRTINRSRTSSRERPYRTDRWAGGLRHGTREYKSGHFPTATNKQPPHRSGMAANGLRRFPGKHGWPNCIDQGFLLRPWRCMYRHKVVRWRFRAAAVRLILQRCCSKA